MNRFLILSLFLGLLSLTSAALAQDVAGMLKDAIENQKDCISEENYLTLSDIDLKSFPPPPKAGSAEDVADLKAVLDLNMTRTKADCQRSERDAAADIESFFGKPNGPLTTAQLEKLTPLFYKVFEETDLFVNTLKQKWKRQRPFVRSKKIKLCITSHPSLSYPSGHSSIAFSSALTLGLIYPEFKTQLLNRAQEIAQSRVIGGVHHPKDIEAGRKLGEMVFEELQKKKNFQDDVLWMQKEKKAQ